MSRKGKERESIAYVKVKFGEMTNLTLSLTEVDYLDTPYVTCRTMTYLPRLGHEHDIDSPTLTSDVLTISDD